MVLEFFVCHKSFWIYAEGRRHSAQGEVDSSHEKGHQTTEPLTKSQTPICGLSLRGFSLSCP